MLNPRGLSIKEPIVLLKIALPRCATICTNDAGADNPNKPVVDTATPPPAVVPP